MPFLAGAGEVIDSDFSVGSQSLSAFWGGEFEKYLCKESPNKIISSIHKKQGLFQLIGDIAFTNENGESWIEALGAWRMPTILFSSPSEDGHISGQSAAYVALCKQLSVPLIGIIQLGGNWNSHSRSLDGLPWCGLLPVNKDKDQNLYSLETKLIVNKLMQRISLLSI
ncbi:hypothetical protein [Prochlorococcus sp. MIT 1223]|uniref:hypothetical protein n=1 Tax=Prochlorococcus sp. MIT 1223 TaxID=3096217 RepID=UPI002A75A584|nr:hypothetical protein [Prochlorococcus sp. MIT 1223]